MPAATSAPNATTRMISVSGMENTPALLRSFAKAVSTALAALASPNSPTKKAGWARCASSTLLSTGPSLSPALSFLPRISNSTSTRRFVRGQQLRAQGRPARAALRRDPCRRRPRCAPLAAVTKRVIKRFTRIPQPEPPRQLDDLTERELDVFRLIARGLSNAEIGRELYISDTNVKTHITHILQKLDLRDCVQAVVLAYETGLSIRTPDRQAVATSARLAERLAYPFQNCRRV